MKKYKLKELRELVRLGCAEDITNADMDTITDIHRTTDKIGYSSGVYGINGGLLKDFETGALYAILSRNTNLFRLF